MCHWENWSSEQSYFTGHFINWPIRSCGMFTLGCWICVGRLMQNQRRLGSRLGMWCNPRDDTQCQSDVCFSIGPDNCRFQYYITRCIPVGLPVTVDFKPGWIAWRTVCVKPNLNCICYRQMLRICCFSFVMRNPESLLLWKMSSHMKKLWCTESKRIYNIAMLIRGLTDCANTTGNLCFISRSVGQLQLLSAD